MDLKTDEGLKALLESGKHKGYLTYSQVNDYLPDDAVNPEKLDQLLLILEEQGIELHRRYKKAFPMAYSERFSAEAALYDIAHVEDVLANGRR